MSEVVTISVCTTVKNEAVRLPDYFAHLDEADEIVLVDTGSTDKTLKLIEERQKTNPRIKLFHYSRTPYHYAAAKNFSMDQANGDYIFVLDADELPEPGFFKGLREILDKKPNLVRVRRQDEILPHLFDEPIRIIKKGFTKYTEGPESHLHEQLIDSKNPVNFNGKLIHRQAEKHWLNDTSKMYAQLEHQVTWTPKTKSFLGHFLRGLWMFQYKFRKLYFSQNTKADGWKGFIYALMRAYYDLLLQIRVGLKRGVSNTHPNN